MKHTEYIIPIGEEAKDFDEIFIGVLRKHKELIRCKDCIYARMTIDGNFAKYCLAWQDGDALMMDSLYLPADFYCAFAERKDE